MKIADVLQYDDFIFALCSFLDSFKLSDDKYEMICDEPEAYETDRASLCILAAVAHKLSNDYSLDMPEWIDKELYIMPYPIYSFDTKNREYQQYLIETSPDEFACRNIYFGANAIERV